MTALGATMQKSSLQKNDLELDLEELEEAATMVAEEEEEQGASKSAMISRTDSSTSSDSSSSSSSESSSESEESEAEEQGCTVSDEGGGETTKDSPPQSQPTSAASPIPHEPTGTLFLVEKKAETLPSASGGCRQLIQELGERVAEELRISPDSSCKAERSCSQLSSAAPEAEGTSGRSSGGTYLELSPRQNPLLIVQTQCGDEMTATS